MPELLIAADDRTGALEVAGMAADAGAGSVLVVTDVAAAAEHDGRVAVVDLSTRQSPVTIAEAKARGVDALAPTLARGHKIDSTLRGNWAHELLARAEWSARRVLVVPAFPRLGRTCVGGIVRANGVPVADGPAGRDRLNPAASSRPADLITVAGCPDVHELVGADGIARWMSWSSPVAICDAQTDQDLAAIGTAWTPFAGEVLFAGTGAALAAAVAALLGDVGGSGTSNVTPLVSPHALVVCGSLHPVARRQLEVLRLERPDIEVLATPAVPDRRRITRAQARAAVDDLAASAHGRLREGGHRTAVLIGGDTAAAVLGRDPMLVGGTLAAGLPWLRRADGSGPLILTRSGGFGDDRALVELLSKGGPA